MALPITGPLTSTSYVTKRNYDGSVSNVKKTFRTWYRQKRPYDRPLEYNVVGGGVTAWKSCSPYWKFEYTHAEAFNYANGASFSTPVIAACYNKAYSRLLSKIKEDTAEMGANMVEFRKTAAMVEDRSVQLARFFYALRRGRFGEANALLRVPSGFRPKARSLGGATLEYSFGWAPVVADLRNGMKILTGGVPPGRVRASAITSVPEFMSAAGGSTGTLVRKYIKNLRIVVTAGCVVRLTNPNLWLANQMGIVNPFSIFWEAVPFSFVVDYFVNVSDVLNSWSDMMGIDVVHPYRSFALNCDSEDYAEYGEVLDKTSPCYPATWTEIQGTGFRMYRELSLPGPTLRLAPPNVSLRRATTSIALLLQLLKGR